MHSSNKAIGAFGENLALRYLEDIGYNISAKNYRNKLGEIDLIAWDKKYLVFIEVKTRYSFLFGTPGESINFRKKYKIYKTAQYYICEKSLYNIDIRFDVIEVVLNTHNDKNSINLIQDAFRI